MRLAKKIGFAILSGVLLGAAWFSPLTFLIFIALIPLLLVTTEIGEGNYKRPKTNIFLYSYLTFLIWNTIDTWWTWFASPGGAIFAILANALLMSLTFLLFYVISQSKFFKHKKYKVWLLVPVWLSFEYGHSIWELAWTWLTFGNVFAYQHNWVQWYEFTGVSGGSLWVLTANIFIYHFIKGTHQHVRTQIIKIAALILTPILLSFVIKTLRFDSLTKGGQKIVIVQPNIDPYNDKFFVAFETQLLQVYEQLKNKIDDKTNYLVLPETFFTESIWENEIEKCYSVRFLRDSILKKYPNLIIVTGASTFYRFSQNEKLSATAHKFQDADLYYDTFNTGLQLDNFENTVIYHKSKLVPGVERMPYPAFFKPLEKLTIDLGGTSGSLGTQETRAVFFNKDRTVGVAPVICYESVFGEYLADYIKNGANLIFIITNDGWWRDSPGYVQHLNYARLRAIETRCPIARCANTGISCFVSPAGEISQETKWWEPAVISGSLAPNDQKTFFVRFGDILSKGALIALLSVVLLAIIRRFKK